MVKKKKKKKKKLTNKNPSHIGILSGISTPRAHQNTERDIFQGF